MSIRKITGATSSVVVSANTTRSGIFKATANQTTGIQRLQALSNLLIPKAANASTKIIDRLTYDPEGAGFRRLREFLGFIDTTSLYINKATADEFTLFDEILLKQYYGRSEIDTLTIDELIFVQLIGTRFRGFGEFFDVPDFINVVNIRAPHQDLVFATEAAPTFFINKSLADTTVMEDLTGVFDGITYNSIITKVDDQTITDFFARTFTAIRTGDDFADDIGVQDAINFARGLGLTDVIDNLDQISTITNYNRRLADVFELADSRYFDINKSLRSEQAFSDDSYFDVAKLLSDTQQTADVTRLIYDANRFGLSEAVITDLRYFDVAKLLASDAVAVEELDWFADKVLTDQQITADSLVSYVDKVNADLQEQIDYQYFTVLKQLLDTPEIVEAKALGFGKLLDSSNVAAADDRIIAWIIKGLSDSVGVAEDQTVLSDGFLFRTILSRVDSVLIEEYFARTVRFVRGVRDGFREIAPAVSRPFKEILLTAKVGVYVDPAEAGYELLPQEYDQIYIGLGVTGETTTLLTDLGRFEPIPLLEEFNRVVEFNRIFDPLITVGRPEGQRVSGDPQEQVSYDFHLTAKVGVNYNITGYNNIGYLFRNSTFDANQLLSITNVESIKYKNYNDTWYSEVPTQLRASITDLFVDRPVVDWETDLVIPFDAITFTKGQFRLFAEDVLIDSFITITALTEKAHAVDATDANSKFFNKGIVDTKSYYRQTDADAALLYELFYNTAVVTDPALTPIAGSTTYKDQYNWYSIVPLTEHGAEFAFGTDNGLGVEALESKTFFIDKRFDETYPAPGQGINLGPLMVDAFSFGDNLTYDLLLSEADSILIGSAEDRRSADLEHAEFVVLKIALTGLDADRTVSGTTVTAADTDRVFVGQQYGDLRLSGDPLEQIGFLTTLDAKASVEHTITGYLDVGYLYRNPTVDAGRLLEFGEVNNTTTLNYYNRYWYSPVPYFERIGIFNLLVNQVVTAADRDRIIAFDQIQFLLGQYRIFTEFLEPISDTQLFIQPAYADDITPADQSSNYVIKSFEDTRSYYRENTADANLLYELFYNTGYVTDPTKTPIAGSTTYIDQHNWYSIVPLTERGADFAFGTNNELGVEMLSGVHRFIDKRFDETWPAAGQGSNLGPLMVDAFSFGDNLTYDFIDREFDSILIGSGEDRRSADLEHAEFWISNVRASEVTLGRSEGFRVSDSDIEKIALNVSIEAKTGVEHTITGLRDVGYLFRDHTFDANQLIEIYDADNPSNNYNSTWYNLVPTFARLRDSYLLVSETVPAAAGDLLIAFDSVFVNIIIFRSLFDETVIESNTILVTKTFRQYDEESVIADQPAKNFNKHLFETKVIQRNTTADANQLAELFFNTETLIDSSLSIYGGTDTFYTAADWYRLTPRTDYARFAYGIGDSDGPEILDEIYYYLVYGKNPADILIAGGNSGTRINDELEQVSFYLDITAKRGNFMDYVIDNSVTPADDAAQVADVFVNQPGNVYGKNWFQLAPYYSRYSHNIDHAADPDGVRVGEIYESIRLAGSPRELISFDNTKPITDFVAPLINIDFDITMLARTGVRNIQQTVTRTNNITQSEDLYTNAWTTTGLTVTTSITQIGQYLPFRDPVQDAGQVMELFTNQPYTYALNNWFNPVPLTSRPAFTSNGISLLQVTSSNTEHVLTTTLTAGSEQYFTVCMYVQNAAGVNRVRLDAGLTDSVDHYADFDISTGEFITSVNVIYAAIQAVDVDWYLLKILGPLTGTANLIPYTGLDMLFDPNLEYGNNDLMTDTILPIPLDLA